MGTLSQAAIHFEMFYLVATVSFANTRQHPRRWQAEGSLPWLAAMHNERYADMAGLMGLPKVGVRLARLDCHYLTGGAQEPVLALAPLGQVCRANGVTANAEKHLGALVEALAGKIPRTACDILAISEKRPGRRLAQVITLKLDLQHMWGTRLFLASADT